MIPSGFAPLTFDTALASAHLPGIEGRNAFDHERSKTRSSDRLTMRNKVSTIDSRVHCVIEIKKAGCLMAKKVRVPGLDF